MLYVTDTLQDRFLDRTSVGAAAEVKGMLPMSNYASTPLCALMLALFSLPLWLSPALIKRIYFVYRFACLHRASIPYTY